MSKINNVAPSTSNAQMPVDASSSVSSLYELYNQMPKVIEASHISHTEPENVAKLEKPSLWQQFKTKAQNITKSASDFVKRHPQAVKTALVATAVAVVAGVVVVWAKPAVAPLTLPPSAPKSPSVKSEGDRSTTSDKSSHLPSKPAQLDSMTDSASKSSQLLQEEVNVKHTEQSTTGRFAQESSISTSGPIAKKIYSGILEKREDFKNWGLNKKKEWVALSEPFRRKILKFLVDHPRHMLVATAVIGIGGIACKCLRGRKNVTPQLPAAQMESLSGKNSVKADWRPVVNRLVEGADTGKTPSPWWQPTRPTK